LRQQYFFLTLAFAVLSAHGAERLPALGADASAVTVSGVSAGGYMAVQMHVAHSATVKGAGILAGGPYYCAQGSLWTAYYNCMKPAAWAPMPSTSLLLREIQDLEAKKEIDPAANLGGSKVWLFSGTRDETVLPQVVQALRGFYEAVKASVVLVADKPAGHAMVVEQAENACGVTAPPFINDCDYDAAGALLGHLLGPLTAPATTESGRLARFDQKEFASGDAAGISLADEGFVYVPKACEAAACRAHIAFHGCRQGVAELGDGFVRAAGYNRWADVNRLVVLYPQAIAREGWSFRSRNFVWNPRGCWDWWGYNGAHYHTKDGAQIRAVKAMMERITSRR